MARRGPKKDRETRREKRERRDGGNAALPPSGVAADQADEGWWKQNWKRVTALTLIGSGLIGGLYYFTGKPEDKKDNKPAAAAPAEVDEQFDNSSLLEEIRTLSKDSKGIVIGEAHIDDSSRFIMYKPGATGRTAIEVLKETGHDALIMEMFRTSDQNLLDDFYEGRIDEKPLLQLLNKEWRITEGSAQQYLEIAKEAKRCGMRIYGGYADITSEEYKRENEPEILAQITGKIDNNVVKVARKLEEQGIKPAIYIGSAHITGDQLVEFSVTRGELPKANKGITEPLGYKSISLYQVLEELNETVVTHIPEGADAEVFVPKSHNSTRIGARGNPRALQTYNIIKSPYLQIMDYAGKTMGVISKLPKAEQTVLQSVNDELNAAAADLQRQMNIDNPALSRSNIFDRPLLEETKSHYLKAKEIISGWNGPDERKKEMNHLLDDGVTMINQFLHQPAHGR